MANARTIEITAKTFPKIIDKILLALSKTGI